MQNSNVAMTSHAASRTALHLFIVLSFFCSRVNAGLCVTANNFIAGQNLKLDVQTEPCAAAVVLTAAEYQELSGLVPSLTTLFDTYFLFDLEVFSAITILSLTLFITGYTVGRVSRVLSRS